MRSSAGLIAIGVSAIAAIVTYAAMGRYVISAKPGEGGIYVLDRITGEVRYCLNDECVVAKRK